MLIRFVKVLFLVLSLGRVFSQTECSQQRQSPGVFICDPDPAATAGKFLPEIFHLSAQANSGTGASIRRYLVYMDGALVFQNRLVPPQQRLSLELNLKAKSTPGPRKLRLVVESAGAAELAIAGFRKLETLGLCDPIGGTNVRTCSPSALSTPLSWKSSAVAGTRSKLTTLRAAYGRNLTNLEADIADAVAVDDRDNLLFATHSSNGIELRKYAPNGSIVYDSVINMCNDPTLAVAAVAVDNAGKVWIAGNTRAACLPTTPGSVVGKPPDGNLERGFVVLLDTSTASNTMPVYSTYLSETGNHISGIRADAVGNAIVCGATRSPEFPHQAMLNLSGARPGATGANGFIAVINHDGSRLLSSTLFPNAPITVLAVTTEAIYVSGPGRELFLAGLSADATRLQSEVRFGTLPSAGVVRALSASLDGSSILLQGVRREATPHAESPGEQFLAVASPCRGQAPQMFSLSTKQDSVEVPEIANSLSLDAFAKDFSARDLHLKELPVRAQQSCSGR